MKEKTKFALYLEPTLKTELEERFREDGSRSQTEFVEKALQFYLDYLNAENGGNYLPLSIRACIEGIFSKDNELTYEMAHSFINAVYIYDDNNIEIEWKFKDVFTEV